MFSRIKPIRPVAFNNDGSTFARALGWTDVCTSGTGPINVPLGFDWNTFQNFDKYYAVLLDSATEYTFTGTHAYSQAKFAVYDQAGTLVAENNGSWQGEDPPVYVMPSLVWTPTTTGVYVVRVSYGGEMPDGEVTYATSISPRPGTYTREGFTPYESSTGFDDLGGLIRTRSAKAVGLAGTYPLLSAPNDLTANNSNPAWLITASSSYEGMRDPWMAFNGTTSGDANNYWAVSGPDTSGWIAWRSMAGKALVRRYEMNACPEPGYEARTPKDWTLEGSDDGINWTVLHTVTNGYGGSSPSGWQLYQATLPVGNRAYYYHRINVSASYGEGYMSIGQIRAWSK